MRRSLLAVLPIWACSAWVSSCATLTPHATDTSCSGVAGSTRWARTELYFGMGMPNGTLTTNEEYQRFVDETVTPRFREGFTVYEGRGQYLDPNGKLWREPTKVLVLMYPPDPAKNAAIEEIRSTYKKAFQQEAVMRADSTMCVAF